GKRRGTGRRAPAPRPPAAAKAEPARDNRQPSAGGKIDGAELAFSPWTSRAVRREGEMAAPRRVAEHPQQGGRPAAGRRAADQAEPEVFVEAREQFAVPVQSHEDGRVRLRVHVRRDEQLL